MKTNNEFKIDKHSIGYVSSGFEKYFGNTVFKTKDIPKFQKLPRSMTDAEIESELKPGLCELGDILAFLENPSEECKDGYFNLFYFPTCVVRVSWDEFDGRWGVGAWPRGGGRWDAGKRVFSPATISKSLESSSLDSFDPLVLISEIEDRLTILKKLHEEKSI